MDKIKIPVAQVGLFAIPSVAELTELTEGVRFGLDVARVRVRVYRDGRPWSAVFTPTGEPGEVDSAVEGVDAVSEVHRDDSDELIAAIAQSIHEDLTVQAEAHVLHRMESPATAGLELLLRAVHRVERRMRELRLRLAPPVVRDQLRQLRELGAYIEADPAG
jgi:hypothetical protein